ncbi:MAG: 2-iminoacetate synthase ThiH [Deltaproteobacteria bacterium]|nr:2-iminoacetate synthase ThiH [Deltaproteobacteria bacterium]
MSFSEEIEKLDWENVRSTIAGVTARDVERSLQTERRTFRDVLSLLSPAAESYLESMAQIAHNITVRRFGRIIQMYAPIYVSSECTNSCVYCGFNRHNAIERATLTLDEAAREGEILHREGFRHVLLVSGESPRHASVDYLCAVAERLRPLFASISIEVYPLDTDEYRALIASGVDGLTIYQETYHKGRYAEVHPAGRKRNYKWRLDTTDRGGEAGFRRLNIGALLGLSDWRIEGAYMAFHAAYLTRRFWKSQISVSFPRLRPAAGGYEPEFPVSDPQMVQLMCALRLFLPDAGLVLSTRESRELRDNLVPLGVTQMSAGSKTAPGGYASKPEAEGQFEVSDKRSPGEVAHMIASRGYEPVWKDWDAAFLTGGEAGSALDVRRASVER